MNLVKYFWDRFMLSVILGILLVLASLQYVSANIDSCQANSTPNTVQPNSQTSFSFTLVNNGPGSIVWIKIYRPSPDFDNLGSSWAGSTSDSTDNSVLFGGTPLASGDSVPFIISAHAGNNLATSANWSISASDNSDGSNAVQCGGSLGVAIEGSRVPDPDITPPVISDLNLSTLQASSVIVSWTTDEPTTSDIVYGETVDYGFTAHDASLSTNHSMTLQSLTPNTGYHFQITASDAAGNITTTDDSTFLTPIEPVVVTKTITVTLPPALVVPVTAPSDKTPPTIAITSTLPNVVKVMPSITGTSSDNVGVARLEYSTDGGQNWLPVDSAPQLGSKQVNFSFTPAHLDDGSYMIMARAIDAGGNITTTPAIDVVVDRLPPIIGGILVSSGPHVLTPDSNGIVNSIVGVDQKITMNAVGGPTSISLTAQKIGAKTSESQVFNLTESSDTGLWSGIISFTSSGKYSLTSNAIDGAGNKTSQLVSTIDVTSDPHTYSQSTGKAVKSSITLYYLEPDSNSWVVWDGSSYDQRNPQTTDSHGNFKLFLPAGKYYLKATANGYQTLVSSIFKTSLSEPLTTSLALKPLHRLNLGPIHLSLPTLTVQKINLTPQISASSSSVQHDLIGKPLPDFALSDTNGSIVHATDLLGRPTLITFGATWSPTMSEQVSALSNLQTNKDLNIMPIAMQEGAGQVRAYTTIAGLTLNWLVDPDSTLTSSFGSPSLPSNYFIDRSGIIKQIVVGVMTQKQIEDVLGGL